MDTVNKLSKLIGLTFGMIIPVQMSFGATLFVDNSDSTCNDETGTPYCTIQAALDNADIEDNIRLLPGVYSESITINQSISLLGENSANTVVDGTKTATVINVNRDHTVLISKITIINGAGVSRGGGIVNMGILTIEGCVIRDNVSRGVNTLNAEDGIARDGQGGGIYNEGEMTINDCIISSNHASGSVSGRLGCNRGTVLGSPSTNALGGAIYNVGFMGLTNCLLNANSATGGASFDGPQTGHSKGGAIYNSGTLTVKDCKFDSNTAKGGSAEIGCGGLSPANDGFGGGIYNAGTLIMLNTENTNNSALGGVPFAGKSGSGLGGALYNEDYAMINHSIFKGNQAKGALPRSAISGSREGNGMGGALVNLDRAILEDIRIDENTAAGAVNMGGGIVNSSDADLKVVDCSIGNNTTSGDGFSETTQSLGGGLYNNGRALVRNSTISSNLCKGGTNPNACSGMNGEGGGVYNSGSLDIANCTVNANTAQGGDAIFDSSICPSGVGIGGGIYSTGSADIHSCTITDNSTIGGVVGPDGEGRGGGIHGENSTRISNTIVARNNGDTGIDCSGTLISHGFNLVRSTSNCIITGLISSNITGVEPMLGPLRDNGGTTLTQALLKESPAIDTGSCGEVINVDQRGQMRPVDITSIDDFEDGCDIGAYEFGGDMDKDGLSDDWEFENFADLRFNGTDDLDNDGFSNLTEFSAGSSPLGIRLELRKGWNLVSISNQPQANTIEAVFGDRMIGRVWTWNNETKRFEGISAILARRSHWVYAAQDYIGNDSILIE